MAGTLCVKWMRGGLNKWVWTLCQMADTSLSTMSWEMMAPLDMQHKVGSWQHQYVVHPAPQVLTVAC